MNKNDEQLKKLGQENIKLKEAYDCLFQLLGGVAGSANKCFELLEEIHEISEKTICVASGINTELADFATLIMYKIDKVFEK